ncbi:MAG: hypothetical protein K0U70_09645 [Actinomycetia bacterium]|nr:hypothetical protein [Actinomycetes bacterium]MCH9768046.1 hypothetical protein [Actinomycetes bacterium]
MTGEQPNRPPGSSPARPPDVDTGFWLWVVSLPLMVGGYVIDMFATQEHSSSLALAINGVFLVILAAVVVAFLILMRYGYRWARALLTGGAIAAVAFTVSGLFTVERPDGFAVGYAVSAIFGSVLIVGGVFLLHRRESNAFFAGEPSR